MPKAAVEHAFVEEDPASGFACYTFAEAAWILNVAPGTVKGWCNGYLNRRDPRPAVVAGREIGALVFFDELVELRVVRFLRDQKIPLPRIREASHRLARHNSRRVCAILKNEILGHILCYA
jgi:hypothetical protein